MKDYLKHEHAKKQTVVISSGGLRKAAANRATFSFSKNGLSTGDIARKKLAKSLLRNSDVIYKWPTQYDANDPGEKPLLRSINPNAGSQGVRSQNLIALLTGYTQQYIVEHNGDLPFLFQGFNLAELGGFSTQVEPTKKIQSNVYLHGEYPISSTFVKLNQDGSVDFLTDVNIEQGDSGLVDPNRDTEFMHRTESGPQSQVHLFKTYAENYNYIMNFRNVHGYNKTKTRQGSILLDAVLLCGFTNPYLDKTTVASWEDQPGGAGTTKYINDAACRYYAAIITDIISHLDTSRMEADDIVMPIDDVITLIFIWFANSTNTGASELNVITNGTTNQTECIVGEDPIFKITGLRLMIPEDMLNTKKECRNVINAVYKSVVPNGTTTVVINGISYAVLRSASSSVTGIYARLDDDGYMTCYFDCLLPFDDVQYDEVKGYYYRDFDGYELMQMHIVGFEIAKMGVVDDITAFTGQPIIGHLYSCNSDSDFYDSTGAKETNLPNLNVGSTPTSNERQKWNLRDKLYVASVIDGWGLDDAGRGIEFNAGAPHGSGPGGILSVRLPYYSYGNVFYSNGAMYFARKEPINIDATMNPISEGEVKVEFTADFTGLTDEQAKNLITSHLKLGLIPKSMITNGGSVFLSTYDNYIKSLSSFNNAIWNLQATGVYGSSWKVSMVNFLAALGLSSANLTDYVLVARWWIVRDSSNSEMPGQHFYLHNLVFNAKTSAAAEARVLAESCHDDFVFEDRMYVGRMENPYGLLNVQFSNVVSTESKQYAHDLATNKYTSSISQVALRALSAVQFEARDLARLVCLCQDQEEELTPEKIENYSQLTRVGLATETSILRDLIIQSKQTRTSRISNIIAAIDEAIMNRGLKKKQSEWFPTDYAELVRFQHDTENHILNFRIPKSIPTNAYFTAEWVGDDILALDWDCETKSLSVNESAFDGTWSTREDTFFVYLTVDYAGEASRDRAFDHWHFEEAEPEVEASNAKLSRSRQSSESDFDDLTSDEITTCFDQPVEVDAMFAQDNPDFASMIFESEGKRFIKLGHLFQYGKIANSAIPADKLSNQFKNYLETKYSVTSWSDVGMIDLFNEYCDFSDRYDDLSEDEKKIYEDLRAEVQSVKSLLASEYSTLTVDSFSFSLEDAIDAIDDTITEYEDGIEGVINDKIDSIIQQYTDFDNAFTSKTENFKDGMMAVYQESSDRASALVDSFKAKAAAIATDAKSYYQAKIAALKDDADSSSLPFSLDALVSKVRSYAGNLTEFLGDVTGLSALSNTNTGWQDSSSFTNTSTITAICGVAQSGLQSAISTCFNIIGKVGSALASNIKKFMYSTFKDGVSYRVRKTGYNTVGLQATTLVVDRSQFAQEFPWIWETLNNLLDGTNSYYNVCQIGPLLMFIQDYDVDRLVITLNPILIQTNDYVGTKNDYYLSESMAHSIIYSINFYNRLIDFILEIKPNYSNALFKLTVPSLNAVLNDILSKAEGVSSARAWGLKALILGIGIAAGAILCATGYGSAIGIGLIAACVVVGECCTPEPVDQSKIERLKSDATYANSVVTAADLASIWTSHLNSCMIDSLLFIREKLSNVRTTALVNGQEYVQYGTIVHNGTGLVVDPMIYLEAGLDDMYIADNDKYHFLGYIPAITYSGTPSFKVMLITDKERFIRQGAQLLAFTVLVGTATVKAAKAGIQHWKRKKINKLTAESWSLHSPDESEFSSYQKDANGNVVFDEAGQPVMTVDKAAYAKARQAYNKKQYKISKKTNRLSNSLDSVSCGGLFANFKSMVSEAQQEDAEENTIDYLIKRIG